MVTLAITDSGQEVSKFIGDIYQAHQAMLYYYEVFMMAIWRIFSRPIKLAIF